MCMTVHSSSGVTLFTAALGGSAGRAGNSVGNYMCDNLQCSRYLRGELKSEALVVPTESLDLDARIDRLRSKLDPFVERILAGSSSVRRPRRRRIALPGPYRISVTAIGAVTQADFIRAPG